MKWNKNLGRKPSMPPLYEIRKDLSLKKTNNYLIVEGTENSSDYTVYNKIKEDKCKIIPAGKKEDIVNDFKTTYSNQLAIVDKDYETIKNKILHLFYTDYNDIECTAINIINNHTILRESLGIDIDSELFETQIYRKALELSTQISNFNKYIIKYNNEHTKKYKYILNIFINANDNKLSIDNVRKLKDIFDKACNIKYKEIIKLYKKKYGEFNIELNELQKEMNAKNDNNFRGHDFFIILAYLIDYYKIKVFDLNNTFYNNPSSYLEHKFILAFAESKEIIKSNIYKTIVKEKKDIFKIY